MNRIKINWGFTLIELLIVIAIIGILASFIIASMSESRAQAFDAERLNDLKQMQVALELYYNRNREYPATLSLLSNDNGRSYIDEVPTDPRTGDDYRYTTDGNSYGVQAASDDETIFCHVSNGPSFSGFSGPASNGTGPGGECPFY